jgi:organic radical activating enzyme
MIKPPDPIPTGNYAYLAPPDAELPYRLHLRVNDKGLGTMIVNASTILHLNQTATEYAYHLIQQTPAEEIAHQVSRRYRVSAEQSLADFQEFARQIETLITTPDLDPVAYLGFERSEPYREADAPYRMDIAITYQLPDGVEGVYAPHDRVVRELDSSEWKAAIDKAWNAGIPHIVFTGGEPLERSDLMELLHYCENYGMVTGIITGSLQLKEEQLIQDLLLSGLDHLMVVINPEEKQYWSILEKILPLDLFTAVHITLTPGNVSAIQNHLQRLAENHPNAISLSASQPDLFDELQAAREYCATLGLELVWELPVPYMHLNPITLEIATENEQINSPGDIRDKTLTGAGKAWLYVEPDGDVLPDQSINQVLGNVLTDSMETIIQAGKII